MTETHFTCTQKTQNEYHEDDRINGIMKWVRYAKTDEHAIYNLKKELQEYDERYGAWTHNVPKMIGFFYWSTSVCLASIQGGFWWTILNICLPISPAMELAKLIYNQ